VLPFAVIGLVGFSFLRAKLVRWATMLAVATAGAAGIAINVVGAFYGAMYCDVQVYALWPALAALQAGSLKDLPLAKWLVVPVILSLTSLILFAECTRWTEGSYRPEGAVKQERGHARLPNLRA